MNIATRRWWVWGIGVVAVLAAGYFLFARRVGAAGRVTVTAQPQQLWLEVGARQSLNFDLLFENHGQTPLGLDKVELQVFDSAGVLVLQRFVDSNGTAPSIETVPQRIVEPGGKLLVFNPFHSFEPGLDLHTLTYRFSLSIPGEDPATTASLTILPRAYPSQTELRLPLDGSLLVHDGHDFYAHHRRLQTEHPIAQRYGLTHNFMRYALDLTPVGEDRQLTRGAGGTNEDWYGWNAPVLAPAAGTVIDAGDGEPDNEINQPSHFNPERLKETPMRFYGNYIVIDHGHGEFSLLGHLKQSSLQVKTGDVVVAGQPVARIGSSGSSNNPHLHYELRDGPGLSVEGLPAIFHGLRRLLGQRSVDVSAAPVDTGDFLRSL